MRCSLVTVTGVLQSTAHCKTQPRLNIRFHHYFYGLLLAIWSNWKRWKHRLFWSAVFIAVWPPTWPVWIVTSPLFTSPSRWQHESNSQLVEKKVTMCIVKVSLWEFLTVQSNIVKSLCESVQLSNLTGLRWHDNVWTLSITLFLNINYCPWVTVRRWRCNDGKLLML